MRLQKLRRCRDGPPSTQLEITPHSGQFLEMDIAGRLRHISCLRVTKKEKLS